MACASITDLATFIWNDLGQPIDQPVSYIQTKLINNAYLGKLGSLLALSFSGVSGYIAPELTAADKSVYALMYEKDYYTTKLNQTLAGLNPGVISLAEGDSRMVFVSPIDRARMYRDAQKQVNEDLQLLIASHRQNASLPVSVDYITIISNTTSSNGGGAGFPRGYYRT